MTKVWSVTIKGKNDTVVMTDEQAMIVKMKFAPNIDMHDLTTLHGLTPAHLHKIERNKSFANEDKSLLWMKNRLEMGVYGGWPGEYEKAVWEYQDLINMK